MKPKHPPQAQVSNLTSPDTFEVAGGFLVLLLLCITVNRERWHHALWRWAKGFFNFDESNHEEQVNTVPCWLAFSKRIHHR